MDGQGWSTGSNSCRLVEASRGKTATFAGISQLAVSRSPWRVAAGRRGPQCCWRFFFSAWSFVVLNPQLLVCYLLYCTVVISGIDNQVLSCCDKSLVIFLCWGDCACQHQVNGCCFAHGTYRELAGLSWRSPKAMVIVCIHLSVSSPWYNPTGWLGVKHQLTCQLVSVTTWIDLPCRIKLVFPDCIIYSETLSKVTYTFWK